jgi:hypothetical protein
MAKLAKNLRRFGYLVIKVFGEGKKLFHKLEGTEWHRSRKMMFFSF